MSKKLLVAISIIATLCVVMATSYWWSHSTWPTQGYLVHLKAQDRSDFQCSVLTTIYGGQRIMAVDDHKTGKYVGCYLYVQGELNAEGTLRVLPRVTNPFDVSQWQTRATPGGTLRTIKASDLDGICPVQFNGYVAPDKKLEPNCRRFNEAVDALMKEAQDESKAFTSK